MTCLNLDDSSRSRMNHQEILVRSNPLRSSSDLCYQCLLTASRYFMMGGTTRIDDSVDLIKSPGYGHDHQALTGLSVSRYRTGLCVLGQMSGLSLHLLSLCNNRTFDTRHRSLQPEQNLHLRFFLCYPRTRTQSSYWQRIYEFGQYDLQSLPRWPCWPCPFLGRVTPTPLPLFQVSQWKGPKVYVKENALFIEPPKPTLTRHTVDKEATCRQAVNYNDARKARYLG